MSVITLELNQTAEMLLDKSVQRLGMNYNDLINQSIINFCQSLTLDKKLNHKMQLQQAMRERGFGVLEGKATVKFADDWHMTDEELLQS